MGTHIHTERALNQNTIDSVYIRTTFEGEHRWKDAPDAVSFLRNWHRHIFHVELGKRVKHDDRDVEFILLKRAVDSYITDNYRGARFEKSCEMIARELLTHFQAVWCDVSEDGENGAIITSLS